MTQFNKIQPSRLDFLLGFGRNPAYGNQGKTYRNNHAIIYTVYLCLHFNSIWNTKHYQ